MEMNKVGDGSGLAQMPPTREYSDGKRGSIPLSIASKNKIA
jgi:hypothetical protein